MIINTPDTVQIITEIPTAEKVTIVDVQGSIDNPIYTYKIPIKIDLRRALEVNISNFSIKLLNKSFNQIADIGFLNLQEEEFPPAPTSVNTALNNFSESNMIRFLNNQKDAIVATSNLDFKEVLDNQVLPNYAHLTDEELFGTEDVVVVANSNLDPNSSPDLTTNLSDPALNQGADVTFEEAVDMLYQEGDDPASSFYALQDELSYTQARQGLIPSSRNVRRIDSRAEKIKSTIRTKFLSQAKSTQFSEGSDLTARENSLTSARIKAFRVNQSLRYQEINFYIDVEKTTIDQTGGKVYLAVECYDIMGLIYDLRSMTLIHGSFSEDLTIFLPDLSVASSRSGVNKDVITLAVTNNSFADVRAKVYHKVTNECGSLDLMRFEESGVLDLKAKESKRLKFSELDTIEGAPGGPVSAGSVLFRVVPEILAYHDESYRNISNTYFTNLKSTYLERNVFAPIMTYNREDHVQVEVHKIPQNVRTFQIVKRNVSLSQREFQPIKNEIGSVYPVSLGGISQTVSLLDYDVKDENIYEYKVMLYYGPGENVQSLNSRVHEFLRHSTEFQILGSPVLSNDNAASGNRTIQMNIQRNKTPADKIFDQLVSFAKQPPGLDGAPTSTPAFQLFQGPLSQISSAILDVMVVRAFRFDCTTGEEISLGEFNVEFNQDVTNYGSVEIIEDVRNSAGFVPGRRYIYTIKPYLRTAYEILVDVKTKLNAFADQSREPGKRLISQLIRTLDLDVIEETGGKFYSRSALKQGTIQSNRQSIEEVNGDLIAYGRLGNFAYVTYDAPPLELSIAKPRVSVIKAVEGLVEAYQTRVSRRSSPGTLPPALSSLSMTATRRVVKKKVADKFIDEIVKIQFGLSGNPQLVDYFVIVGLKNGESRIVGAIHCPSDETGFTFIDQSQIGFQGQIVYSVYAVAEDKSVHGPFNLGNVILGSEI